MNALTKIVAVSMITFSHALVYPSEFFVSPTGTNIGSGTRQSPWDISTAFADNTISTNTNYAVKPGDTVWLLGGTYSTYVPSAWPYVKSCKLAGTSNSPIVLRQYPGERAIIDGGIYADTGSWTTFWGFEITCSNGRTNLYSNRPAALSMSGVGQKAINLVIYNTGHAGIGSFQEDGIGREIHGCIIWGVGIFEYDNITTFPTNAWTRGAGMYLQNRYNTLTVSDNISSRNLTEGMQSYGQSGFVNGFVFDGNITFKNNVSGIAVDCLGNSISNSTVINNIDYRSFRNTMGYFGDDIHAVHSGLIYSNNYQITYPAYRQSALWLKRWQSVNVVGNTIVTTSKSNEWLTATDPLDGYGGGGNFVEIYPITNSMAYTITSNHYHGGVELSPPYQPFRYKIYEPELTFGQWTNTYGFDLDSTYATNLPTANVVVLRTNKYEIGRSHVVVLNYESNSTATVNLANSGLSNGQQFEVRDSQNFLGDPVLSTAYNESQPDVIIPLTMTNVTAITGEIENRFSENPNVHTASLFNAFVILPVGDTKIARSVTSSRVNAQKITVSN